MGSRPRKGPPLWALPSFVPHSLGGLGKSWFIFFSLLQSSEATQMDPTRPQQSPISGESAKNDYILLQTCTTQTQKRALQGSVGFLPRWLWAAWGVSFYGSANIRGLSGTKSSHCQHKENRYMAGYFGQPLHVPLCTYSFPPLPPTPLPSPLLPSPHLSFRGESLCLQVTDIA